MKKLLVGIRFIYQDLRSDGWRSLITVFNLVIFISCYFCLASMSEAGFKFGVQARNADQLMMISRNVFELSDSQITDSDFTPIRELTPWPVISVSPLILRHMNVENYYLQVRGTRLQDFTEVYSLQLLQGDWPEGEHEVVIGEGTVSLTNWKVGQVIRIFGVDFTIRGVVRSSGTKFASVWMSLDEAEKLFGTHGAYQFAWIVLAPDADSEQVLSQLNADPRIAGRFEVYYADQLYQQYTNALDDFSEISLVMMFFSLLSVMLGVYGSTYLTLTERSRELTILRAIGFKAKDIRLILVLRTNLQVMLAFLLGWLFTYIAVQIFQKVSPITIHSIPLPVIISPQILAAGAVLSFLFAWIGVWLPTRHLRHSSVISMIQR